MMWIHKLCFLGILISVSEGSNAYERQLEEAAQFFRSFEGAPKYGEYFTKPDLDSAETTYFVEDDGQNRRSFQLVDPEPGFTRSHLYVSPEDVRQILVREKRAAQGPDEDYDYTKSYRQFVKENFGFNGDDAKPLSGDYEEDDGNESEYEKVKQLSAKEAVENQKHPEYCKHVTKDGKHCMICQNPKTHAKSESCSYSSAPPAKKYAYKRERNYNSKDDQDDDDHNEEASEQKEAKIPKKEGKSAGHRRTSSPVRAHSHEYKNDKANQKTPSYDATYYVPKRPQTVDKVLAEFKAKDWSKCQRKAKNGLTCYYCKDENGVSQEECMYLSEDSPEVDSAEDGKADTVKNTKNLKQRKLHRSSGNRRVITIDTSPQPEDELEVTKRNKGTHKRMVTYDHDLDEVIPTTKKSVFYAKKITQVTK